MTQELERREGPLFGRWSIDEPAATLVRDDRKAVRFVGFVDDRRDLGIVSRFDRRWMQFETCLGDEPYALLVERRDVAPTGALRDVLA